MKIFNDIKRRENIIKLRADLKEPTVGYEVHKLQKKYKIKFLDKIDTYAFKYTSIAERDILFHIISWIKEDLHISFETTIRNGKRLNQVEFLLAGWEYILALEAYAYAKAEYKKHKKHYVAYFIYKCSFSAPGAIRIQ